MAKELMVPLSEVNKMLIQLKETLYQSGEWYADRYVIFYPKIAKAIYTTNELLKNKSLTVELKIDDCKQE